MKQKELRNNILKLLKETSCITETQIYKELSESDTAQERTSINKAIMNLAYEGKIIWTSGDLVGILSLPRTLH